MICIFCDTMCTGYLFYSDLGLSYSRIMRHDTRQSVDPACIKYFRSSHAVTTHADAFDSCRMNIRFRNYEIEMIANCCEVNLGSMSYNSTVAMFKLLITHDMQ